MTLRKLQALCEPFYAPVDSGGGAPPVVDLDAKAKSVDTYDLLGDDEDDAIDLTEKSDKKIPKTPEPKDKDDEPPVEEDEEPVEEEEEEEEIDELAELEQELEEPDEEKLELITPVRRKEILAKYPKLFKDFPYIEKAYYRDQQFTEIYPTIDDARVANEKAQTLDEFEAKLVAGTTEDILKAVKADNQEAFYKIVDNYLIALWNSDQMAYHHIIGNINKTLVANMVQEGKRTGNDALIQAASIVNQYVFGKAEWEPPTRLSKADNNNPDRNQLDTEKQQFAKQRFETARDEVTTKLTNRLRATIEQNIDPQGSMTPYVKKAAIQDAMDLLEKYFTADKGFEKLKDKLWKRAIEENCSKATVDKVLSACATKAKVLLPTVIKKARNEALKGLGKRVKKEDDTEDREDGSTRTHKPGKTTSPSRSGNSYADKAKKIPRGMSTAEYFNTPD